MMATSFSSKNDMQAEVDCDTCENTANHLCKTCLDRLCDKCKIIHSKSKGTFDHDVVLLTYEAINLASECPSYHVCKWHTKFRANVGCRGCKVPVCEKCLIGDHNGHNLMDINELFQYKKNKLEQQLSKLYSEVPKYESKVEEIKRKQIDVLRNRDAVKKSIVNHFEKVNSTLHSSKEMLLKSADEKAEKFINSLTLKEKNLHSHIDTMQDHINNSQNKDLREKIAYIYYADCLVDIPSECPSFTEPGVLEYSEAILDRHGQIQLGSVSERLKNFHVNGKKMPQIIRTLTVGKEPIVSLAYSSKLNAFWIFSSDERAFRKYDMKENCTDKIEVKSPGFQNRQNIAVGEKLVVYVDNPNKLFVLEDSRGELSINVAPMVAVCLCLTSDDDILVGLHYRTEKIFANARFNVNGERTQYITHVIKEWTPQPLLSKSHSQNNVRAYIAENINRDICLSVGSDNVQAVIIICPNGDHRNTYKGVDSSNIPCNRPFLPRGICTNILGHIFVADENNGVIHMLDTNGTFVTMLTIPNERKIFPISLCIDNQRNLCIGCADGKIRILKYLN